MTTWTTPRPSAAATTPLVEIVVTEGLLGPAAGRLAALVSDALALRPEHLVIDLAACPNADAFAIDVLLAAHRRAWQLGTRLILRTPPARLRRVFEIAHVDHVFDISMDPAPQPPPGRRREMSTSPSPRVRP
jgi:anti-sigma B factor antagonist